MGKPPATTLLCPWVLTALLLPWTRPVGARPPQRRAPHGSTRQLERGSGRAAPHGSAGVDDRRRQEVSLSWREVPDALIARCGFEGLRGALTDRLVREGYALVKSPGPTSRQSLGGRQGVRVMIDATSHHLRIRARYRGQAKQRLVRIPSRCDSSLMIDLGHTLVRVVGHLVASQRDPPSSAPASKGRSTDRAEQARLSKQRRPKRPANRPAIELKLGLTAVIPGSLDPLLGIRTGVSLAWEPIALTVGLSFDWHPGREAMVFEPGVSVGGLLTVVRHRQIRLRLGVETTALYHAFRFTSDGASQSGRFDGRLAIVGELSIGRWLVIELLPYLRFDHTRHLIGSDVVYQSRHFGLVSSIAWRALAL